MKPLDVKIARIRAGISQLDMAKMLNLKQPTLSGYESGYRRIPPEVLQKILDILKDHNPEGKES